MNGGCNLYIVAARITWEYNLWLALHYSPKQIIPSILKHGKPNAWVELNTRLEPVVLHSQKPFVGVRVFYFSAEEGEREAFFRRFSTFLQVRNEYSMIMVYEKSGDKYIRIA